MGNERTVEYRQPTVVADDDDDRLILDALTDTAIFKLDAHGVVQRWFAGAQAVLGFDAEDVIGRHVSKFVPHDQDSKWINDALTNALTQRIYINDCRWACKSGQPRRADATITALFTPQGLHRGFVVVSRPLEEQHSDTSAEPGSGRIATFMDVLAHELRNPLAPITNAISILDRTPDLNDNVRHVRDIIVRQSRQMTRVIDGLFDISRISEGKVELDRKPVRLDAVISEAVKMTESLIQIQSHTLTVDGAENAVWVNGDKARLIQVIGNLLHNAAKFTPQCGAIEVGLAAQGDLAVITVSDNGLGIDPQRLPTLFSRFEQRDMGADKTFGGLGLGLSLAYELVRLHGGTITASSTGISGEGSFFEIHLPRIAGPVEETTSHDSNAVQTVLVVDDNRDSALVISMLLETMGYRCLSAYSGIEAVETVKKERPSLVILDIGLPDIDGYEVARRIADEIDEPPPLLALTGYGGKQDRQRSLKAGFSAHVVKPVDADNLQMLLHTMLAD